MRDLERAETHATLLPCSCARTGRTRSAYTVYMLRGRASGGGPYDRWRMGTSLVDWSMETSRRPVRIADSDRSCSSNVNACVRAYWP